MRIEGLRAPSKVRECEKFFFSSAHFAMFRKQYTTRQKQTVLSYLTTHTPKETSIHYGIHISMVYKWNYSKDKINQAGKKAVKPGAGRKPMHPEIEQLVHEQAMQSRREGICVTLSGLAQSMRMAVQDPSFKASSGWIKGYKKRHPCKVRVPTAMIPASKWNNEPGIPAHEAAKIQAFFDYKRFLEAKHAYSNDRVINMDETPVYFNNPSKKTVHYGLTKDPVAVKVMEGNQRARVTVMLTCTRAGDLMSPCIVECSKNKAARIDAGSTIYER